MKKSYLFAPSILIALFLILGLSGCTKKVETKNQNQEVGNQKANVQETDSQKQNISIDGPIISDLKPGDKIGDYVIKEIKGALCQSDCKTDADLSGSISFAGEHVITGKFHYSAEYPIKIGFIPNDSNKIPYLGINHDKDILELLIGNQHISMMNDEFIQDNFSIITSNFPGFADFIKEKNSNMDAGSRDTFGVFDKDVAIKIKNYSTNSLPGGEAGPMAEFVEIVKSDNQIVSTKNLKECITLNSVSYKYPVTWGDCSSTSNGAVTFRTDYSKHKVDLVLSLIDSTQGEYERLKGAALNGVNKLDNASGEFYEIPTGGSLMAGGLKIGEKYYKFVYNIKSDQSNSADIGEWMADNNVKYDDMVSILKSMKSIAK